MNILVVEDEFKIASFLKQGLEEVGFTVDVAYDGDMGLRLATNNTYDIILLDIIIPKINGIDLCKEIRQTNTVVPIIMLSALGTTDDKLTGFDTGADDYLVKPFELKELIARIRALTKRTTGIIETSNILKIGDIALDLDKCMVKKGNKDISLTAKEFSLLEYLIRNKGRVVSRAEIAEKVWDISFDTGTNIVDVYINILRKKIDTDETNKLIHTKIGMGYMFNID